MGRIGAKKLLERFHLLFGAVTFASGRLGPELISSKLGARPCSFTGFRDCMKYGAAGPLCMRRNTTKIFRDAALLWKLAPGKWPWSRRVYHQHEQFPAVGL